MAQVLLINKKTKELFKKISLNDFLANKYKHLTTMHVHSLWLQCQCTKAGAISFVKRNNTSFVLVNHPIHGKHHYNCRLHTNVSGEINHDTTDTPQSASKAPSAFTPLKIAKESQIQTNSKAKNKNTNNKKKSDRIHSLLTYALEEKGLNILTADKVPNLNSLFYSKMFSLPVTKNKKYTVKVSDITYILPSDRAQNYQQHLDKIKYKFANDVPLQSNFIFFIDDMALSENSDVFEYKHQGKSKRMAVIKQIHHYQKTKGPRLVFTIKALINTKWQNYLVYTHPIVSIKHPVLVDSSYERDFAQHYLNTATAGSSLTKPYLAKELHGSLLLPDFIYKDKETHCIVEVMGMLNQDEYKERKKRLVPLMEKRFSMKVIEVTPDNLKAQADSIFN